MAFEAKSHMKNWGWKLGVSNLMLKIVTKNALKATTNAQQENLINCVSSCWIFFSSTLWNCTNTESTTKKNPTQQTKERSRESEREREVNVTTSVLKKYENWQEKGNSRFKYSFCNFAPCFFSCRICLSKIWSLCNDHGNAEISISWVTIPENEIKDKQIQRKLENLLPWTTWREPSLGSPRKHMRTHTHKRHKQHRKIMKEHKRSRQKKFQNFTEKEKLKQVYLKRTKTLCENITQKNVYSYREIEREEETQTSCKKELAGFVRQRERERERELYN